MTAPLLSYLIASYNHERFVERCVTSVLRQTERRVEAIVVDDGSRDATPEIVRRLAEGDSRVRLFVQENRGVVNARNRAVAESRGKFLSLLDSDDSIPEDRTEKVLRAFGHNSALVLVYGNARIVDENDRPRGTFFDIYPPPVSGNFSEELWARYCFTPAQSVTVTREALGKSGDFWGPGANMDYLKWIEIGMRGEIICLRGEVLSFKRWHGANESRPPLEKRIQQYETLKGGLLELLRRHPEFAGRLGQKRIGHRLGRCHFMAGFYAGLQREWPLAREQFRRALAHDRSLINYCARSSTLPLLNTLSSPLYRLAANKFLGNQE